MSVFSSTKKYIDGSDDGLIRVESKEHSIVIYKIPHASACNYSDNYELKVSGIYLLINEKNGTIYVGQADSRENGNGLLTRMLEPHSSDEINCWDFAYSIASANPTFLLASELNYLERFFYNEAKKSGHYTVLNAKQPHAKENIVLDIDLRPFINCVLFLFHDQFQFDMFVKKTSEPPVEDKNEEDGENGGSEITPNRIFFLKTDRKVMGIFLPDRKVEVRADTVISTENHLPSQKGQESNAKLRAKLNEDGIIVNNIFVKNYIFNTPSQAASVILGRSANGNTEWVDENGILFDKYPEAFHKKSKSVS